MTARSRVLGIDFSGARDAGNKIWIAEAIVTSHGIEIESCKRARDLPGGAVDRESALRALVEHIAGKSDALAGFDFPFSLPATLISESSWENFVLAFAGRYPTPGSFRDDCATRTGGRELKRRTDIEARVPFSAYNLRLYRQTYWGIREVLHPLIVDDAARVIPMQTPRAGASVIAEICPASTLKRESLYGSYKGRDHKFRMAREFIVEQLIERRALRRPDTSFLSKLLDDTGGDALDAVIAAIGAARVAADPDTMSPRDDLDRIEARVYF
jgi:hypothetical protein